MTWFALLREGEKRLSEAGIQDAAVDSRLLLFAAADFSDEDYLLKKGEEAPEKTRMRFLEMLEKRARRVPVQYITGKAWFYGYSFTVNESVLIPRFDTEVLLDCVLKKAKSGGTLFDLCTGSGILAVVCALEGGFEAVTASDISKEALAVAKRNAEVLKASVCFIESDLFEKVTGRFDTIVSNPPYVTGEEIAALEEEVRAHEPFTALYGGEDGLRFYRRIVREAPAHLTRDGQIFLEIGESQGEAVRTLMAEQGFKDIAVVKDLAGLDRVVYGRLG